LFGSLSQWHAEARKYRVPCNTTVLDFVGRFSSRS